MTVPSDCPSWRTERVYGAEDVGQAPYDPVASASGSDGNDACNELVAPQIQVLIRQRTAGVEVGVWVIAIVYSLTDAKVFRNPKYAAKQPLCSLCFMA